jgi:hypothetical protein
LRDFSPAKLTSTHTRVCVCCVLCFVLQPTTRRLYLFFSGRNFFQFYNNMTDGYLRFISTVGQMPVPFFFRVVIFSGCNLNLPKNMASQMTVPFFSGSKFFRSYVSTIIGARVKIRTPITTPKNYKFFWVMKDAAKPNCILPVGDDGSLIGSHSSGDIVIKINRESEYNSNLQIGMALSIK